MKIAAVDLGSNTFHLIIAEYTSKQINIVYKLDKPVRLSENITINNQIISKAFARGIACLQEFKIILDSYEIDKIRAVATSAVRSADNGEKFIHDAKLLTGIDIEIISGHQEAGLIYQAVNASGAISGKTLIMDIGGGSTEFIFCDEEKSYWKKSFDIGAARLMQKFWTHDPISLSELQGIEAYLDETLTELVEFNKEFSVNTLVGSAGAFETFYQMSHSEINVQNIKSAKLDFQKYIALSKKLKHSTHLERSRMSDLIPLRVDMIVMACVLTDYIIEKLNIQDIRMTSYDLKYGILHSLMSK